MDERIQTLHPSADKRGVNISKAKYEQVREAILEALAGGVELTFTELDRAVAERLAGQFDGSISWYTVSVKLDLEARAIVERTPGRPQRLRLTAAN